MANSPRPEYQPFADALRRAMESQGLSASDVARRVWGSHKDKRGYDVATGRDRIGHYLAARSYPEPANLEKLAGAIGVPVDTLTIQRRPQRRGRPPGGGAAFDGATTMHIVAEAGAMRDTLDVTVPFHVWEKVRRMLIRHHAPALRRH